jgi:hypothetical protein
MRITYWESEDGSEIEEAIKISTAKKLLKEKGGRAWTEIYERDGTMCESVPINIKSNKGSYAPMNHHL